MNNNTNPSKYQSAANSYLASALDESPEAFEARKAETIAIADRLDCGIWHAASVWYAENVTLPVCYLCGGTMRDESLPAHSLCEARTNRGRTDLPVINYEPKCGCHFEGCEF